VFLHLGDGFSGRHAKFGFGFALLSIRLRAGLFQDQDSLALCLFANPGGFFLGMAKHLFRLFTGLKHTLFVYFIGKYL